MNIDTCKLEDGDYTLLECFGYIDEFEMSVKKGEPTIYQITTFPFSKTKIDDKNFTLKCDLYENENWFKNSDEVFDNVKEQNFSSGRRK